MKNVANFSKMEDVIVKKVLDFLGRMVHNGGYPIRQDNEFVAKRTCKTVENGPEETNMDLRMDSVEWKLRSLNIVNRRFA